MKKSKVFIFISGLIIATSFICNYEKIQVYEKKIYFSTPEEVIDYLDNKPLLVEDFNFNTKITNEFSECLSYRKRVTDPSLYYSKLEFESDNNKNVDDEVIKSIILTDYYEGLERINAKEIPKKVEPLVLKCKGYYDVDYIGYEDLYLKLVLVDEGEGYVIDYFDVDDKYLEMD